MERFESIMFPPEVGEINVHAQTVYTRPSPPPILENLGTRLGSEIAIPQDSYLNGTPMHNIRLTL